jgi:DNA topoisomerase-1
MDLTFLRIGNVQYARSNGSYGITTLKNRHVTIRGSQVAFRFFGKSGVRHTASITDGRLASIVRRCHSLPGHELFGYIAEDGSVRDVRSSDVNAYLRDIAGCEFTAKDFRTIAGSVLALQELTHMFATTHTPTPRKSLINEAVKSVARRLGNTPAVCRKCYIHPTVINAFTVGTWPRGRRAWRRTSSQRIVESALQELLDEC